jgi:hypothetical protein
MSLEHDIPDIIMACVYLHNFVIKTESEAVEFPLVAVDVPRHFSNGAEKRMDLTVSL